MRASEIRGKDVVDVANGHKIGTVQELRLDLNKRSIAGLVISKGGLLGRMDKQVLPFDSLQGIGGAAITAPNRDDLQGLESNRELFSSPRATDLRRPVLTDRGERVGTVEDIEFNTDNGSITGVVVEPAEGYRSPYGGQQSIDIQRIVTLGDENVIVEDGVIQREEEGQSQRNTA